MAANTGTHDTRRKLPQDIYNAIVSFCDGDWKNLRLVNKAFELDATRLLFHELTVCLQERSMKRLVVVSQNEYLAKHVRVLRIGEENVRLLHQAPFAFIYGLQRTYLGYPEKRFPFRSDYDVDDDTPDQEICYQQYKSVIDNYGFFTTPYPEDLNAKINRYDAFELYKKEGDLIFNEAKFLARDQHLECLKGALYNFKNLASVHIMPLPQETNSSRSWGALSTAVLHPESYQDGYCGYPHEDRRLGVFLQVAALVNVLKIKELVVEENVSCCQVLREVGLYAVDNVHILAARPSMAYITYLDIPVGRYGDGVGEPGSPNFDLDVRPHKLANMLRGLPQLEHLACRNSGPRSDRVRIWPALASVNPGHLKSISLECCILRPSVLRKFFWDHAKTLQRMSLNRTYMHHGHLTWMFAEMRERLNIQSLTLISFLVELRSTYDFYSDEPEAAVDPRRDATRKAISDYVTHHTSIFPCDLFDEQGPFGTGHFPGVVQVVGRADFPGDNDHTDDITQKQWWIHTYPDSPVDSFKDCEEVSNTLIALQESDDGPTNEQLCKSHIKVASDGSMTGEEELDEELLRQQPGPLGLRFAQARKKYLRLEGWML